MTPAVTAPRAWVADLRVDAAVATEIAAMGPEPTTPC
jgi:hypothetical protein